MFKLSTGARVVASFAVILFIMTAITGIALWRLQAANDTADGLVYDVLAREQLAAQIESTTQLNLTRAVSIAKSDSVEMSDYFQQQHDATETQIDALDAQLRAFPALPGEQDLLGVAAKRRAEYGQVRDAVFKFKAGGRTMEAEQLTSGAMELAARVYLKARRDIVEFQKVRAGAMASQSASQFNASRILLLVLGGGALCVGAAFAWLITRSIVLPLRRAVELATNVARGDLRDRIESDRHDEIGALLNALAHMNAQLSNTVAKVRAGAIAIITSAHEIAVGNLDLSHRTEQQAGSLGATATSMDALSGTVKQNASNARQADELVRSASSVAIKGGTVVAQMVSTMSAINASSARIVDIIGVIDSIAFQTNILALNAAVEAARAGEQGRGFAVVAAEVRTLAQRSASAAKEIKQLIDDSVAQVAAGSALAEQAGTTMNDIVASVARVTGIMGEISAASHTQEAGIVDIHQEIDDMDQFTKQNAALVEQAAAAASALEHQADDLEHVVRIFTLNESLEGALAKRAATSAARLGMAPR